MSWRTLFIATPARLSLKQNSVLVETHGDAPVTVPMEDIASVVIESPQVTLTAPLLSEMSKNGASLVVCDEKHIPCGVMLPFHQHSRMLAALSLQLEMSVPFCKNCWRLVVKQKILNQSACLEFSGLGGAEILRKIAAQVNSGDSDNREGVAAQKYFEIYFAELIPESTRRDNNHINAALNYGYAILRGAVARSLTSHGFLPALGIKHRNELNAFNLADDFLEPLRPLVDLWVCGNMNSEEKTFSTLDRFELVKLLERLIKINDERVTVLRAIEVMCSSFVTAARAKKPELLLLPELVPIENHRNE